MKTGDEKNAGTEANVYVVLIGTQATTDKINLELVQKSGFEPGTTETFSVEGVDVGEIRKIEVGKWNQSSKETLTEVILFLTPRLNEVKYKIVVTRYIHDYIACQKFVLKCSHTWFKTPFEYAKKN